DSVAGGVHQCVQPSAVPGTKCQCRIGGLWRNLDLEPIKLRSPRTIGSEVYFLTRNISRKGAKGAKEVKTSLAPFASLRETHRKMITRRGFLRALLVTGVLAPRALGSPGIDRHALVTRHNPRLTKLD